jgi:hypothetical protein
MTPHGRANSLAIDPPWRQGGSFCAYCDSGVDDCGGSQLSLRPGTAGYNQPKGAASLAAWAPVGHLVRSGGRSYCPVGQLASAHPAKAGGKSRAGIYLSSDSGADCRTIGTCRLRLLPLGANHQTDNTSNAP